MQPSGHSVSATPPASGTNIAVERIDRDRMRTRGRRQVDCLGNDPPQGGVDDHVEEPSALGAIIAGDEELTQCWVVPDLVRTAEPSERFDDRAGARGIEQDRRRPQVAAANHQVAARANGEPSGRAG
jgi:hypothetical protein